MFKNVYSIEFSWKEFRELMSLCFQRKTLLWTHPLDSPIEFLLSHGVTQYWQVDVIGIKDKNNKFTPTDVEIYTLIHKLFLKIKDVHKLLSCNTK